MKTHTPSKVMKCHFCDFTNKRSTKMNVHMQQSHGYTDVEQAYADAFHNGQKQTCECGCGSALSWESWFVGYPKKRVAGHNNSNGKPCAPKKAANATIHDCPWCSFSGTRVALRTHCSSIHGKDAQETYDAIFLDGQGRPKCACGCGEELRFCGIEKGYPGVVNLGHNSRVENNYHINGQISYDKQSETKRLMFETGKLIVWDDGQTKETDFRVAAYGKRGSETISSNPEELERRSKVMSAGRTDGTIRTLYGPEHPQWKGGYSTLASTAHSLLYKSWKFPKLQAAGFKCQHCGKEGDLHVHHDGERFASILQEASKEFNYEGQDDYELKSKIAQRIEQIHLDRNVSGLVLCDSCHAAEHERLGEKYNIL